LDFVDGLISIKHDVSGAGLRDVRLHWNFDDRQIPQKNITSVCHMASFWSQTVAALRQKRRLWDLACYKPSASVRLQKGLT